MYDQNNATNKLGGNYTDQERQEFTQIYKSTLNAINQYDVVKGTVISITNRYVLVSIGYKSDGLISAAEFRDMPNLQLGDEIEVYIEETENAQGQIALSRKKAKLVRGWQAIANALETGEPLEGLVKRRTKGGLIVEIHDIETFLPGSQIDVKPILDFDVFVNQTIDVAIININHTNDNVIVSHKALIEKKLEKQKLEFMSNLEPGQILEGYVKNITKFGAFIDLGGIDGLLHITDISWNRVSHPDQVFTLGQKVQVVVIGFNEDKKRISLGMKQLQEHPWASLPETIQQGSIITGKVTNITDYGLFIEVIPGIEALVHVSEISWSQYLRNVHEHYKVGDQVQAMILSLDRTNYKIALGIKQLTGDPWEKEDFLSTYAVGTRHEGYVRNITNFGAFIELEPGVEGLLHISGLSWEKRISHPSEILKLGEKLEIIILDIEQENRRLALGLKQLEKNPWDEYSNVFQVGTIHKGVITKVNANRGAIAELAYGIEGQIPKQHLTKEDGKICEVGEELDLKVIHCSKEDKKILLTCKTSFNPETDANELASKNHETKAKKVTKSKKSFNMSNKPLRGFEAFANLKEQLESKQENQTETCKNNAD